jgi:hypothetical protein
MIGKRFMHDKNCCTVVVQIGNSDDKLSQAEWSEFVLRIRDIIGSHSQTVHFDGGSRYDAEWQNACFVSEVQYIFLNMLLEDIKDCRTEFRQDSAAVTVGPTVFV